MKVAPLFATIDNSKQAITRSKSVAKQDVATIIAGLVEVCPSGIRASITVPALVVAVRDQDEGTRNTVEAGIVLILDVEHVVINKVSLVALVVREGYTFSEKNAHGSKEIFLMPTLVAFEKQSVIEEGPHTEHKRMFKMGQ